MSTLDDKVVPCTAELVEALAGKICETVRFRRDAGPESELRDRVRIAAAAVLLEFAETTDERERTLLRRIEGLLRLIGDPGRCGGCNLPIYWVRHVAPGASGRRAPYTHEGLNHFADCPAAERYRRARDE